MMYLLKLDLLLYQPHLYVVPCIYSDRAHTTLTATLDVDGLSQFSW